MPTTLTPEDRILLRDFNRNIHWLKSQEVKKSKPKWVKASDIKDLTGWDTNKMRRARINEVVIFKIINGERVYDLNSLPDQFIKSINHAN